MATISIRHLGGGALEIVASISADDIGGDSCQLEVRDCSAPDAGEFTGADVIRGLEQVAAAADPHAYFHRDQRGGARGGVR